jgi:hypothetical protein
MENSRNSPRPISCDDKLRPAARSNCYLLGKRLLKCARRSICVVLSTTVAGVALRRESPNHDPQVTRVAVAFAVMVNLIGMAIVTAAAWIGTVEWFPTVLVWIFHAGLIYAQLLIMRLGHFTSKGRSVSRIGQPVTFWATYWFWICAPLVFDILILLGYAKS